VPAIDRFGPDCYTAEKMKLLTETRKILETPGLPVSPTTVRVPVFTSHSISVTAETETKITAGRARDLFARFPGLKLWDDPAQHRYPMPIAVEGQDDCFVGRIREDLSSPNGLSFSVVGEQLRKGAATNAVQIAELLLHSERRVGAPRPGRPAVTSLRRSLRRRLRRYDRFHLALVLTILVVAYVAVPRVVRFVDSVRGYDPAYYEPKDFERVAWIKRQVAPTV